MDITAHAHDNITPAAARPSRRVDAGSIWLSQRDIDRLLLCGEHWGAPSARSLVARAAGSLPPAEQARVVVRDLPGYAFTAEPSR